MDRLEITQEYDKEFKMLFIYFTDYENTKGDHITSEYISALAKDVITYNKNNGRILKLLLNNMEKKLKIKQNYDEVDDILNISLAPPPEKGKGVQIIRNEIVIRINPYSWKIYGITILDFKRCYDDPPKNIKKAMK